MQICPHPCAGEDASPHRDYTQADISCPQTFAGTCQCSTHMAHKPTHTCAIIQIKAYMPELRYTDINAHIPTTCIHTHRFTQQLIHNIASS